VAPAKKRDKLSGILYDHAFWRGSLCRTTEGRGFLVKFIPPTSQRLYSFGGIACAAARGMPGFWVTFCHEKVTKEMGAITHLELVDTSPSYGTGCSWHRSHRLLLISLRRQSLRRAGVVPFQFVKLKAKAYLTKAFQPKANQKICLEPGWCDNRLFF